MLLANFLIKHTLICSKSNLISLTLVIRYASYNWLVLYSLTRQTLQKALFLGDKENKRKNRTLPELILCLNITIYYFLMILTNLYSAKDVGNTDYFFKLLSITVLQIFSLYYWLSNWSSPKRLCDIWPNWCGQCSQCQHDLTWRLCPTFWANACTMKSTARFTVSFYALYYESIISSSSNLATTSATLANKCVIYSTLCLGVIKQHQETAQINSALF